MADTAQAAPDATAAPAASSKYLDLFKTALMYPTLLLAIGGSINIKQIWTWIDLGFKVPLSRVDESLEQRQLLYENLKCAQTLPDHTIKVRDDVSIGAAVCNDTGDVVIGALDAKTGSVGIPWVVPLKLISSKTHADAGTRPDSVAVSALSALVASARAQTPPQPAPPASVPPPTPIVLCQRFLDNAVLLRRIQTGSTCVDEKSNVYQRQVISREPVQCSPTC